MNITHLPGLTRGKAAWVLNAVGTEHANTFNILDSAIVNGSYSGTDFFVSHDKDTELFDVMIRLLPVFWTGEEPNLAESGRQYPYTASELAVKPSPERPDMMLTDAKLRYLGFKEADQSSSQFLSAHTGHSRFALTAMRKQGRIPCRAG